MKLTPEQRKLLGWGITAILLAGLSIGLGVTFPIPAWPLGDPVTGLGTTHFTAIQAEDVTATDDLAATDDISAGDDLTVTDDATLSDALTVAGTTTMNGLSVLGGTSLTVTNGHILTPTETIYWLQAAGTLTITLGASCTDGQILITYGEDNQTINIADTNIKTNDGAKQVLGQYDNVMWLCRSNVWIELGESNDS